MAEVVVSASRFDVFRNRNFRVYFIGQLLSTFGTWLQIFAQAWLVLDLTDDKGALAVTIGLSTLPLLLFGSAAGSLADRVDNRKLLIMTSSALGLLAALLGFVSASGHVTLWWVNVIAVAGGFVSAVERPVSNSILFELVGREQLSAAVGINSTIMSAGRLVSPAIGGVIVAVWGKTPCFFANAASFLIVIAALVMLRPGEMVKRTGPARARGGVREGFRYVRSTPAVRRPMLMMAIIGLLAYNFPITSPAMVKYVFEHGARAGGITQSISGIGSVLAGIWVAGRAFNERRLALAAIAFGAVMTASASAPSIYVYAATGFFLGATATMFMAIDQTVLQQAAAGEMQGRVMSLFVIATFGTTPIGAFLVGGLIKAVSARAPLYVGGIASVLCGVALLASSDASVTSPARPQVPAAHTPPGSR